jgi:4-hydroxy-tetrahydrodipicolinate reductase
VSFEFQHNVCGRSIYAEGTVDAAMFLHKKVRTVNTWLLEKKSVWCYGRRQVDVDCFVLLLQIQDGANKKLYDMIDVLSEGNMR